MLRNVIIIGMMLFLIGCGSKRPQDTSVPLEQPQSTMTPLEKYVATADMGGNTFIVGTRYGDVKVFVRNQYYAASGKLCRLVEITTKTNCSMELAVCHNENGEWKEVPVLWDGCSQ